MIERAFAAAAAASIAGLFLSLGAPAATESYASFYLCDKFHRIGEKELKLGHLKEAEQTFNQELKQANALGENDPRLARSLEDLGLVYESESEWAQAEKYLKGGLGLRQRAAGVDSPDVVPAM